MSSNEPSHCSSRSFVERIFAIPLGENSATKSSGKMCEIFFFYEILELSTENSATFNERFEILERCKGVHCVDLGESFPKSIYLQNLPSIQPRTGLSKFAENCEKFDENFLK